MNTPAYYGNPLIRPKNIHLNFSKHQIDEQIKCMNDPLYFIKTYAKIISIDEGLISFDPFVYQEEIINLIHNNRFVIAKLPRQSGKTTILAAYLCWLAIFNPKYSILVAANKQTSADDIMTRVKLCYENLPEFLQEGVVSWNVFSIELENGSKIKSVATASDTARGSTYNFILLDEFAFVSRSIADDFFGAVYPTITSGKTSKMIIISTPKGFNHFWKMWSDACDGKNEYVPIEIKWSDVPGRDKNFKEKTINNLGIEKWNQEYECVAGDTMVEIRDRESEDEYIIEIETLYNMWMDQQLKYNFDSQLRKN